MHNGMSFSLKKEDIEAGEMAQQLGAAAKIPSLKDRCVPLVLRPNPTKAHPEEPMTSSIVLT